MKTRIISAIVAIPIFLFFIIMGGYWLQSAVTLLALVGAYELYKAVSGSIKPVHFVGFISIIAYIWFANYVVNISCVFAVLLTLFLIMIICHNSVNVNDVSVTILGFVYLGLTLPTACTIRSMGLGLIWMPFIYAWVSDTAAYFVGSAIGKHKLAPVLSPKKSIEGAVGAVLITAVISCAYAYLIGYQGTRDMIIFFIFGGVGSVIGQIGDIAASTIKRYTGIKDYGNIMPGHGGVLDRFDSVLFTLPIVYIVIENFL